MLPDAALRPLLAADTPVGVLAPAWAARFPRASWSAIGVLDGFAVVVDEDPAGPEHDLDDEERWWDGLPEPPRRLLAVRDLDLVDDSAWPAALTLLAADRDTRAAATAPGGYTGWWLADTPTRGPPEATTAPSRRWPPCSTRFPNRGRRDVFSSRSGCAPISTARRPGAGDLRPLATDTGDRPDRVVARTRVATPSTPTGAAMISNRRSGCGPRRVGGRVDRPWSERLAARCCRGELGAAATRPPMDELRTCHRPRVISAPVQGAAGGAWSA